MPEEEWEETMVAQSVWLLNSCEDFGSPDAMLFLARQDTTIVTEKKLLLLSGKDTRLCAPRVGG